MFAKLLKHEFRTSKSILGLLSLVALGVAVLATIALKLVVCSAGNQLMLIATPMLDFSVIALVIYAVAGELLLLAQFYKSKFTDEGYLTFTLPASPHVIYLSSLLNILIWSILVVLTLVVSFGIVLLFGTSPDQLINTRRFANVEWQRSFAEVSAVLGLDALDTLISLIRALISMVFSVVLSTTSITIGATAAKKHKILAAVGIYYGISMVITMVQNMLLVPMTYRNATNLEAIWDFTGTVQTVIWLACIVVGYFLTTHMMKKKLNLP